MKNQFLYFLLGIFITISFAAGALSTDILTIKPATPKSTVVIDLSWVNLDQTKSEIKSWIKKGYIVRSTVTVDTRALIIMEKY